MAKNLYSGRDNLERRCGNLCYEAGDDPRGRKKRAWDVGVRNEVFTDKCDASHDAMRLFTTFGVVNSVSCGTLNTVPGS